LLAGRLSVENLHMQNCPPGFQYISLRTQNRQLSLSLPQNLTTELVREDTPPAHYEIGHLRYKTYALHVTVLWVNAQTVRIPVACLEIVGGVTLMRTYVLPRDTNANYLARARFDVLAFARSCVCAFLRLRVLAFVRAFARPGPGD
jgi:hypothetical protein